MRIGIIGTGTIASAVVDGIAADGHTITVSRRSAANAARLEAAYASVSVADNQQVLDQSDVVFIGLMPDVAPAVLGALRFRADQQVISFMADVPLAVLAPMVAPAAQVSVMIPFPAIATGGSPVLTLGDSGLIRQIFGHNNDIFELASPQELGAYLCAQAVLSPAVRMVQDAAGWLGARVQDADQAEGFLRLLVGSGLMGGGCAQTLAALDTPGGYNQRLREHMIASGGSDALRQGLDRLEGGK
jgi:pyrroline-5-carboxylate reductase